MLRGIGARNSPASYANSARNPPRIFQARADTREHLTCAREGARRAVAQASGARAREVLLHTSASVSMIMAPSQAWWPRRLTSGFVEYS